MQEYESDFSRSIQDKEAFWADIARRNLDWETDFNKTFAGRFGEDLRYFESGKLNASVNCVDRHCDSGASDQTAITWEGDEPEKVEKVTYGELFANVNKMANVLTKLGVNKGDAVVIYMPNCPEAVYAMLACSRIGAVHAVVFAGFSAEALRSRVLHLNAKVVVTVDYSWRNGRRLNLLASVEEAIERTSCVKNVLVHQRKPELSSLTDSARDLNLKDAMDRMRPYCPPEFVDSEHPLFVLYTSGSTGEPKGLVHSTGGYLCYAAYTLEKLFDFKKHQVHGCMADIGWITGHTYIVYGPLLKQANTVMFEGIPTYPNGGRYWDMVERHKIDIMYTSPTALRSLLRLGDDFVKKYDRSSLKALGSVGEPLNAAVWDWYFNVVGEGKLSIVDTYWQTETGGAIISPLANVTPMKPGSASLPLPGVELGVLDPVSGELLEGECDGVLVVKDHWPGVARTCFNDHQRYKDTYFNVYKHGYFTGDGCHRDKDGYYFITGRVDDVLNKSGHRIGTAEVESALLRSPHCAEAAVVGTPDELKGENIVAFCTLKAHVMDETGESYAELAADLKSEVRKHVGAIAAPDFVIITDNLPKTRSGKIMRRILRKIAQGNYSDLGDLSTLAEQGVISELIADTGRAISRANKASRKEN